MNIYKKKKTVVCLLLSVSIVEKFRFDEMKKYSRQDPLRNVMQWPAVDDLRPSIFDLAKIQIQSYTWLIIIHK